MKISLVIPTKRRGTAIKQALRSAANQTEFVNELGIVDGSSERMSAYVLNQAFTGRKQMPVLICLHAQQNSDLPAARNLGVRGSSRKIMQFLDDDAIMAPDFFENILPAFRSADVGSTVGLVIGPNSRQSLLKKLFFRKFYIGPFCQKRKELFMSKKMGHHSSNTLPEVAAYRREVFDQDEFDENVKGAAVVKDVDFSFPGGSKSRMLAVPSAKVHHYPSLTARLDMSAVYTQKIRFCHYHYRKNIDRELIVAACCCWLNLDFFLRALTTAKVKAMQGVCKRIGDVFKTSLRANLVFAGSP